MRKSIFYSIANHTFALEGDKIESFQKLFKCGLPFLNNHMVKNKLLFTLCMDEILPDWGLMLLPEWEIKNLCRFDYELTSCVFSKYKEGYLFRMDFLNGKEPLLLLKENNNPCFLTNYSMQQHINIIDFKFALWLAYGIATTPLQTVAIHASTIVCLQKVVLFLGESGTGKSTQSQLWLKHISGATLLNDDSPVIRIMNDFPLAYGSVWSGKTDHYLNEHYPVAAFVRISQAKTNTIKKLNLLDSFAALYPSCPPMFAYDSILSDYINTVISNIIEQIPVFKLDCLPNEESVQLTYSTIFNKDK